MTPPPATDPWAPRPPTDQRMSRRWFGVIAGVWLAIMAGSAWWGLANPTPTERDQTTVASARPVVDEAIARVAGAITADGGIAAVSGFERVGACQISVVRDGERYRRALVAVTPPGTEAKLMDRVAGALPASYRAVVVRGDSPRLSADVGFWVLLTGSVTAPGEVRFVADTGNCRSPGDLETADDPPDVPPDAVTEVVTRLGLGTGSRATASVSCVDGGVLGTVEVRMDPYGGDLVAALSDLDGATPVVRSAELYAYRIGETQVAVRAHDEVTIVTATSGC